MRLPSALSGCTRIDMSAVVAMPARAAVAVLIRSLSTPSGCDPSQSCLSSPVPDLHGQVRRHEEAPRMLAELADIMWLVSTRIGIGSRLRFQVGTGGAGLATGRFPANAGRSSGGGGVGRSVSMDTERAWAIEGTSSYGRGPATALTRCGEWVIEFSTGARETRQGRVRTKRTSSTPSGPERNV